jgi:hypothetical protein
MTQARSLTTLEVYKLLSNNKCDTSALDHRCYLWVVLSLLELHKWVIFRELNQTERIDHRIVLALANALVVGVLFWLQTTYI